MEFNYNKQSQFELFPGASAQPAKKSNLQRVRPQVVFSMENLLFLGVAMIIGMVISFSLGVERGKHHGRVAVIKRDQRVITPRKSRPVKKDQPGSRIRALAQQPVEVLNADLTLPRLSQDEVAQAAQTVASIPERVDRTMYTIQVASFRKEKFAQQEARSLKKKGYEILVIPKGKYSIVCVGRFAKKGEAQKFSLKLKKTYSDCLVRSL